MAFDIDELVNRSGAVKIDDLDWEGAAKVGVTDEEEMIIRYMADTETHTIIYMRDLLAGHSTKDPEITAFLSVWVYEELWHGRALDRILEASGRPIDKNRAGELVGTVTWKERFEALLSQLLASSTHHFIATHMAWGALNEFTAAASYMSLARKTQNPALKELCKRIAVQERKHYAFYYSQAEKRLTSKTAQIIAKIALNGFWEPVGTGVSGANKLGLISAYLFGDEEGFGEIQRAQDKIAQLPGLEGFCEPTKQIQSLIDHYRSHQQAYA
jgi:rubrerythrin